MKFIIGSTGRFHGFQGWGPSRNWNVRMMTRMPQMNVIRWPTINEQRAMSHVLRMVEEDKLNLHQDLHMMARDTTGSRRSTP